MGRVLAAIAATGVLLVAAGGVVYVADEPDAVNAQTGQTREQRLVEALNEAKAGVQGAKADLAAAKTKLDAVEAEVDEALAYQPPPEEPPPPPPPPAASWSYDFQAVGTTNQKVWWGWDVQPSLYPKPRAVTLPATGVNVRGTDTTAVAFEVKDSDYSVGRQHAKVYVSFSENDAKTNVRAQDWQGVYRAYYWLPTTYRQPPAGNAGQNMFQFKWKHPSMGDPGGEPSFWSYTWNAAELGGNPALGPWYYAIAPDGQWRTDRRTQFDLGKWVEIQVVLNGSTAVWFKNGVQFAQHTYTGPPSGASEFIWGIGSYGRPAGPVYVAYADKRPLP
jgi:hypothetical protein